MKQDERRRLRKARDLLEVYLREIQGISVGRAMTADGLFDIVSRHRSSFYQLFFASPTNIDPLLLFYLPVERMDAFVDAIHVLASAIWCSSMGGQSIIASDRVKMEAARLVQSIHSLRDLLSQVLDRASSKVFYSWENDAVPKYHRYFIKQALEEAIRSCSEYPLAYDESTRDTPGSPEIPQTVFDKISNCFIFVADVSLAYARMEKQPPAGEPPRMPKKAPNPNVLVELGYALEAIGEDHIILVFNEADGRVEELPFDIQSKRILRYRADEDNRDRARLQRDLENAIRTICQHDRL